MKNETTSKRVASAAGKAMRGPTVKDIKRCGEEWQENVKGTMPIEFAMRWWHRKVKSAIASALTQAAPAKKKAARKR